MQFFVTDLLPEPDSIVLPPVVLYKYRGTVTSNRQIVSELKRGERSGCTHLMQEFQHKLFDHLVRTFDIPPEDAEEVVSDVLLLTIQRITSFSFRNSEADFSRWVFTILRNRVRDYWRHRFRYWIDMEQFSWGEQVTADEEEIEKEIIGRIVRDFVDGEEGSVEEGNRPLAVVAETLQSMETWERVLLRCRALDIPYEDISKYVEKSAKQLKVYHARVREKFAARLRKEFADRHISLELERHEA